MRRIIAIALLVGSASAQTWIGGSSNFAVSPKVNSPTKPCTSSTSWWCASDINSRDSALYEIRDAMKGVPFVTGGASSYTGAEIALPGTSCSYGIAWNASTKALSCYGGYSEPARSTVTDGLRINTTASIPSCDSSVRGLYWVVQGGTDVGDIAYICLKKPDNAYAWFPISTGGATPPSTLTAITLNDVSVESGKSAAVVGSFTGGVASDANWYCSSPSQSTAPNSNDTAYCSTISGATITVPSTASGDHFGKVWAVAKNDTGVHDDAWINVTTTSGASAYPPPQTPLASIGAQPTGVSEPALLTGSVVNDFGSLGTTVTRYVYDRPHHYSKTSVWNYDQSRVVIHNGGGFAGAILDGTTYAFQKTPAWPSGSEHYQWGNTSANKDIIFSVKRDAKTWGKLDVASNTWSDLKTYTASDFGQSVLNGVSFAWREGGLSNDDTAAVLIGCAEASCGGTQAGYKWPAVINPVTGAVRCIVTTGGATAGGYADDATVSQNGEYVLVNWKGGTRSGIDAYEITDSGSCAFVRQLTTSTSHYDACVSQAGDQVVVQPAGSDSKLLMTKIADGTVTTLIDESTARYHVSCRNTQRPGYAYVSLGYGTCDTDQTNMLSLHRLIAVKLDSTRTVETYAWDHVGCPNGTSDEDPEVVPSRDGKRVWWATRWEDTTANSGNVHSYVATKQ